MSAINIEKEMWDYSKRIQKLVEKVKKENTPHQKVYRKRQILQFRYTQSIIDLTSRKKIIKEDWEEHQWYVIWDVRDSSEQEEMEKKLKSYFGLKYKGTLLSYVSKFVGICFSEKLEGLYSLKNLTKGFLNDIQDKPNIFTLSLELSGIAIQPKEIVISPNFVLRKIQKKDLEKEIPSEHYEQFLRATQYSTTKCEIKYESNDIFDHGLVKQSHFLTILQLFKLGNVQYTSIKQKNNHPSGYTTFDTVGYFSAGIPHFASYIKNNEIPKLKKFYKDVSKKIPEDFYYSFKHNNALSIAYGRFVDALHKNDGNLQKIIANSVIAMEALFLMNEDELNYRLKMRLCRFLGELGLEPTQIYRDIGHAYGIRSAFAHGNALDQKIITKLRREYGQEVILAMKILDYVRISIVAFLFIKMKKDDIVNLIDKTWISEKELKKFKKTIKHSKKILNIKNYNPKFTVAPFNKKTASYTE